MSAAREAISTIPAGTIARGRPLTLPSMHGGTNVLETVAAWLLGVLWVLPLVYAIWTAFHPPA